MVDQQRKPDRLRIAILCGGRSGEHEISLLSARSVINALNPKRYETTVVGIGKDGRWQMQVPQALAEQSDPSAIHLHPNGAPVLIPSGPGVGGLIVLDEDAGTYSVCPVDVVFPVLHGPFGEDGTVQGLLELSGIPYIGAGTLGSAVGMDKDVMKRLLRDAGIPTPRFMVLYRRSWLHDSVGAAQSVWENFSPPVFVKPANLGSSVGITKVNEDTDLPAALEFAFRFDTKAIIEETIDGREIECSVLGNDKPEASIPGEVIPRHEFYSYEAKYLDDEGATLKIPADLPSQVVKQVQGMAVAAYRTLECEGMGRVDFFYTDDGRLFVSEINTIPGFTRISMYPKLWEASGLSFPELIDRLIECALERHERRSRLSVDHR